MDIAPTEQSHVQVVVPINAAKLRKKKETVYFILVLIVSVAVWAGAFWGLWHSITAITTKPTIDESHLCYGQSFDGGSAFIVPDTYKQTYLDEGESCIDPSTLDPEQREAALKEYRQEAEKIKEEDAGFSVLFFILIGFLFVGFLMHLYALAFVRMTGVRVGPDQFSSVWNSAQRLAARLGMKKVPDVFILNGEGMLNAFATKLISRKIVVLFSDLAEALSEPENQLQLDAVLAHELGHHALGHTKLYHWLLYPGEFIPFISLSLSREREYSADRVMQALIENQEAYERGLIKLAAGKAFGNLANIDRYVDQIKQERGFMVKWAEYFSSHPFLPKRIRELRRYKEFLDQSPKI